MEHRKQTKQTVDRAVSACGCGARLRIGADISFIDLSALRSAEQESPSRTLGLRHENPGLTFDRYMKSIKGFGTIQFPDWLLVAFPRCPAMRYNDLSEPR